MLEELLIDCCSPTLASLKSASLFRVCRTGAFKPEEAVQSWNEQFAARGLQMKILHSCEAYVLIYLFRTSQLYAVMKAPEIRNFLHSYGYPQSQSVDKNLAFLMTRLDSCESFPHEIGVFLGYPLDDVIGFIENRGENYKYLGPWKVYGNEAQSIKTFARYQKCREVYSRLFSSGRRTVLQMTVAG